MLSAPSITPPIPLVPSAAGLAGRMALTASLVRILAAAILATAAAHQLLAPATAGRPAWVLALEWLGVLLWLRCVLGLRLTGG